MLKQYSVIGATLLACTALVSGCASTQILSRQQYEGARLPRPDRIIIHNFAASPEDIPAWSAKAGQLAAPATPPTPEELQVGRQLGMEVAKQLVTELKEAGLPAVQAEDQAPPNLNDIVIIGCFESVEKGSALERVTIGFGAGSADLKTEVEGYQMTAQGLHRLGSGELESGGGKTPGVAVPIAVVVATGNPIGLIVGGAAKVGGEVTGKTTIEGRAKETAEKIAEQLKVQAQKQGWI
ncbi:MAG TPA: DUF4410 domain-containing protein [Candidatus Acidoferrales bacterium]|nr:DUF4410 domain-containing protein [Candidatus Acidoferrales bacterium]